MKKIISINYPFFKICEFVENPDYERKFDAMDSEGRYTTFDIVESLKDQGIPEYTEKETELNIDDAPKEMTKYINEVLAVMNIDDLRDLYKYMKAPLLFKKIVADAIVIKQELKMARKVLKGKIL